MLVRPCATLGLLLCPLHSYRDPGNALWDVCFPSEKQRQVGPTRVSTLQHVFSGRMNKVTREFVNAGWWNLRGRLEKQWFQFYSN